MQTPWYTEQFDLLEKSLNGESQSPLHAYRRKALAQFTESGFPTQKDEEWRFTNIAPIVQTQFERRGLRDTVPVTQADIAPFLFPDAQAATLVFVDGHFAPSLSTGKFPGDSVEAGSLADRMKLDPAMVLQQLARSPRAEGNPFVALGTAFLVDGAYVRIPDGVECTTPIHLLYLSTATGGAYMVHPRNLIAVGKNASATIVETYGCLGPGTYFNNAVTDIVVGDDARLELSRVQDEGAAAFHIGSISVRQGRGSRFTAHSISFGGAIVRNTVTCLLDGEGGECTLNGMSLATGTQLIDNHTTIDHARPHCDSHELYKSILADRARGVFNGKIFVRKDAQKTDAKQTNKTLLLSDEATIDTKPQLEIFADDVKCTHGATVGQLDDEQLFYLRSRGLGIDEAREMLINAFAGDSISRIGVPALRDGIASLLRERLRSQNQTGD